MGYIPTKPVLDSVQSPVQATIQRIVKCSRLEVTRVQDLAGHLHRVCIVHLSNGSRLALKVEPPPTTFLLRHERQRLDTEAKILKRLSRSSLPIPQVLAHEWKSTSLGSPFLVTTYMIGITYREAMRYLKSYERSIIDREIRSIISIVSQETSSSFGSAGTGALNGHKTWREAFNSMLESILMDGEDAMVNIPYFQIRKEISRWENYLDDVTEAKLVIPAIADPENVLIDRVTNEVTGLLGFGQAFWGDPGIMHPESCGDIKGLLWVKWPNFLFQHADRKYRYTLYESVLIIVRNHYRSEGNDKELDARRRLTEALLQLSREAF